MWGQIKTHRRGKRKVAGAPDTLDAQTIKRWGGKRVGLQCLDDGVCRGVGGGVAGQAPNPYDKIKENIWTKKRRMPSRILL